MKKESFTFDYVRVSPEKQIGWHSHSTWELSLVLCGGGTRRIGNMSRPFSRGDIVLVPPDIPHEWIFDPALTDSEGCIRNISVFFDAGFLDGLIWLSPDMCGPVEAVRSVTEALAYTGEVNARLQSIMQSMQDLAPAWRLPAMIELLLVMADTTGCMTAGKKCALSRAEQRLEKVRVYCRCNYARTITLDEMAAYAGMNRSAFCTFMKRHAGMSLSEYVNGIRLENARELVLRTDDSISEIADRCGFRNITYFNRLFQERYGHSPGKLRGK